jgi:hypothetical protein
MENIIQGVAIMRGQRTSDAAMGSHYRSDRINSVNGHYYFATREGSLEGPFFTRVDAEHEIKAYLQRQTQAQLLRNSRQQAF